MTRVMHRSFDPASRVLLFTFTGALRRADDNEAARGNELTLLITITRV